MKKMILAAALFLMSLCFGGDMHAGNFGVCGGANFHTYNLGNIGSGTHTQWHAGFVYKFNLPLGFQIQPSLLYDVKAATSDSMPVDLSVGYIDLNASFQWGPDLILFRPYVEVCPFAGYGVNGWGDLKNMWKKDGNRWEYGVGLGGGLQIWRFQVNARYNWNFGTVLPESKSKGLFDNADFNGVSLSLTYFF